MDKLIDPVTYQVINSRLAGIVLEMEENIFRTGYSTIVRESHDAGCILLDAAGDVVAEHCVITLFTTSLPGMAKAVLKRFGNDIAPGDAFISNHPYLADVTHSVDMALISPFFSDGTLVAWCATIAHKSDLGGMVRGTGNGSAREIFQEGVLYPPVRYAVGGTVVDDIEAIVRANSRTPATVVGDLRGQLGVTRLGERRLAETVERYGLGALVRVFTEKQNKTEQRIRRALSEWPDGTSEAEKRIDGSTADANDGVRFHVVVTKSGDQVTFDFSGSSDQVTMPINVRPSIVRGAVHTALIGLTDPNIDNDGGFGRAVTIRVRRGSIVDPEFPAPTNAYTNSAMALCEVSINALSQLAPGRQMADVGGVGGGLVFAGRDKHGTYFSTYELIGSAYGARSGKDGVSGVSPLITNGATAPIEIMESEYPLRFRRWELITDSGGAGTYRGGLGPIREYEVLADDTQITLRGGKHFNPAEGIAGGLAARTGTCIINPGPNETILPSRFSGVTIPNGGVLRIEKSGGGGLGKPMSRPFQRIVEDVLDGYVSREAAVAVYGADAERLDRALVDWDQGPAE